MSCQRSSQPRPMIHRITFFIMLICSKWCTDGRTPLYGAHTFYSGYWMLDAGCWLLVLWQRLKHYEKRFIRIDLLRFPILCGKKTAYGNYASHSLAHTIQSIMYYYWWRRATAYWLSHFCNKSRHIWMRNATQQTKNRSTRRKWRQSSYTTYIKCLI